jgi:hypothetical protein
MQSLCSADCSWNRSDPFTTCERELRRFRNERGIPSAHLSLPRWAAENSLAAWQFIEELIEWQDLNPVERLSSRARIHNDAPGHTSGTVSDRRNPPQS